MKYLKKYDILAMKNPTYKTVFKMLTYTYVLHSKF